MKLKYCLVILFCLGSSSNISGQSILAGIYGASDYFYDITPDEILFAPIITFPNYNADTFLIDINNDNINDFRISTISDDGGNWHSYISCSIEPLNNNQISIGSFDSCFANCPPPVFYTKFQWYEHFHLVIQLIVVIYGLIQLHICHLIDGVQILPNGCGYGCSGAVVLPNSSYLGLKVFTLNDTLFGWIKIKDVAVNSLTIEEFASNLLSTSIEYFHSSSVPLIYPNPNSGKFSIKNNFLGTSNCNLRIYDLIGNLMYNEFLDLKMSEIDLGKLPKGIYFLKLTSDRESLSSKIIIQ